MSSMKKKLDALRALHGLGSEGKSKQKDAGAPVEEKPQEDTTETAATPPETPDESAQPASEGTKPEISKLADLLQGSGLKTGAAWRRDRGAHPPTPRRRTDQEPGWAAGTRVRLRGEERPATL